VLDLKSCSNAKRYLEETGLSLDEAIEQLEKKINGAGGKKQH